MAKKKSNNFDLDDDLDFDLDKELGDIDFGSPQSYPPPKNAREAISRASKDAFKGFKDEMLGNKLKTAGDLAKASIPKSIRSEVDVLYDTYGSMKDVLDKNIGALKKETAGIAKTLNKLLPENSKLSKLMDKIGKKLGTEDSSSKGPSKEELEKQKIQEGILSALGEMSQKSHVDSMVQHAITSKQGATTNALLQNIYAETKIQRIFTYEVTNKYYRKSLELQYRQLFVQKEMLEFHKFSYETMRNQLEAVIRNTALPDIVKTRSSEFLKAEIAGRLRSSAIDTFYKNFNPLKNMGERANKKLEGFLSGLVNGLQGVGGMLEATADMRNMNKELGITTGNMIGQSAATTLKDFIGNRVGKFIEKSSYGKKGIYKFKDTMADPTALFTMLSNNKRQGKLGDLIRFMGTSGKGLMGSPSKTKAIYGRKELDEPAIFDGRTHTSINKIIPGFLSKIHSELKATRIGLNIKSLPDSDALVFDTSNDMFSTKKRVIKQLKTDVTRGLENNKFDFENITNILKDMGVNITSTESKILGQAFINFMMQPGSTVNPSTIYDPRFLTFIQDTKLANKISRNKNKIIEGFQNDPYIVDSMTSSLSSIRNNMPSINKRLEDMYKGGMTDTLITSGFAKRDRYGNLTHRAHGVDRFIKGSYNSSIFNITDEERKEREERMANANKAKDISKAINSKINAGFATVGNIAMNQLGKLKTTNAYQKVNEVLRNTDKETITDYFLSNKAKVQEFLVNQYPGDITKLKKRFNTIRSKAIKLSDDLNKKFEQVKTPEEREKISIMIKEFKDRTGETLKKGFDEGFNEVMLVTQEQNIKEIQLKMRQKLVTSKDMINKKISSGLDYIDSKTPDGLKSSIMDNVNTTAGVMSGNFSKARSKFEEIREATKDPIAMAEMAYKGIKGMREFIKKPRDLLDLQNEYWEVFKDKVEKGIPIPSFPEWVKKMGYKTKNPNLSIKNLFKAARRLDRKLAFKMWGLPFKGLWAAAKAPFKVAASFLGIRKKGAILKTSGAVGRAGGAVISTALDMLPFGLGTVLKGPFTLLNVLAEKTADLVDGKSAEEKEKNRKGSWMSRLLSFGKKRRNDDNKSFRERAAGFMRENKGLTMLGIMGGIFALTKAMGLDIGKLLNAVKWVGGALIDTVKWIGGAIGKVIDFIPDFIKPDFLKRKPKLDKNGNPILDENGNPVMESNAAAIGGLAAAGGAGLLALKAASRPIKFAMGSAKFGLGATKLAYKGVKGALGIGSKLGRAGLGLAGLGNSSASAVKSAGFMKGMSPDEKKFVKEQNQSLFRGRKPKSIGRRMVRAVADYFNKSWVPGSGMIARWIGGVEKPLGEKLDKVIGSWDSFKNKLTSIKKKATHPKVIKKVGKKVCAKVTAKLVTMVAAAATGIGALLSAGMILWELGWALYYMWSEDLTFWGGLCKQLFGIDITTDASLADEENKTGDQVAMDTEIEKEEKGLLSKTYEKMSEYYDKAKNFIGNKFDQAKEFYSNTWDTMKNAGSSAARWMGDKLSSVGSSIKNFASGAADAIKDKVSGGVAKIKDAWKKYTTSPYIEPKKSYDRLADVKNINPEMRSRINRFAELYYQRFGKLLPINEGIRYYKEQIKTWEKYAKVKYTGNKERDIVAATAAGGTPKMAAYPGTSNHGYGDAMDISIASSEFKDAKADGYHSVLDPMLEQAGLYRPFQSHNQDLRVKLGLPKTTLRERWHVEMIKRPDPNRVNMAYNDPDLGGDGPSLQAKDGDRTAIEQENEMKTESSNLSALDIAQASNSASVASNTSSMSSSMTNMSSSSSSTPNISNLPVATASYGGATSNMTMSSNYGMSTGSIEDVLQKQLMVQTQTYKEIRELKEFFIGGGNNSSNSTSSSPTALPTPTIDLTVKQKFDNMLT